MYGAIRAVVRNEISASLEELKMAWTHAERKIKLNGNNNTATIRVQLYTPYLFYSPECGEVPPKTDCFWHTKVSFVTHVVRIYS